MSLFSMQHKQSYRRDTQVIEEFLAWSKKSRYQRERQTRNLHNTLSSFIRVLCRIHQRRGWYKSRSVCENHNYLYCALRLAYEYRYGISKHLVSKLLREIYLCDRSLGAVFRIFLHKGLPTTCMCYETEKRCERPMCMIDHQACERYLWEGVDDDNEAFTFYLDCVVPLERDVREQGRLVYSLRNILNQTVPCMGATPLKAAAAVRCAESILTLLRYGADPLSSGVREKLPGTAVGFLINELNILALAWEGRWWLQSDAEDTDESSSPCQLLKEKENKTAECLKLMARAVSTLNIRITSDAINTKHRTFKSTASFQVHPGVGSVLDIDSFSQPPSLRHACRHAIRTFLKREGGKCVPADRNVLEEWSLKEVERNVPADIKSLPVPLAVQRYLDLYHD